MAKENVVLRGEIQKTTQKALKFRVSDESSNPDCMHQQEFWCPLSQILSTEHRDKDDPIGSDEIEIRHWMYEKICEELDVDPEGV